MSAHEAHERAEHAEEAGHHNKGVALVISVLALFLAFSETLGKSAQTAALSDTVKASDTWAFYQARNVRQTTVLAAKERLELDLATITDPAAKAAATKKIEDWDKRIQRWESDPGRGEGMKELRDKATALEKKRDHQLEQYHNYEIASAILQIGIVLASAAIITSMPILAWISGLLGIVGLAFMLFGYFAPELVMGLFEHGGEAAGHAAGH
jgi:Domain of unknown function (DUF4337)